MSRSLTLRLLAALFVFALLAAACGEDDNPAAGETSGTTDTGADSDADPDTGDAGTTGADDDPDPDTGETGADAEPVEPGATLPPTSDEECTVEVVETDVTDSDIDNTTVGDKPIIEKPNTTAPASVGEALDLVVGEGDEAVFGDTVVMQYAGTLFSTGIEFDSSWARGLVPFSFTLGQQQVIAGWDLGVAGMRAGGRRQLVLPANCAYGNAGSGSGSIGANETLIFIVDLVAIEPKLEMPATLAGGLEFSDVTVGDGAVLEAGSTGVGEFVAAVYETEEQLGSSIASGQPLTFVLGQETIVPGFDEAVTGMAVGGTRFIILPADVTADTLGDGNTLVIQFELTNVIEGVDPADKPEVVLPSEDVTELVIEDLVEGEGNAIEVGDKIAVQYVGVEYPSGEQFDASWDRGQAFELQLGIGQVIPGWDEGLVGMKVGGRRQLTIPADMAYGPVDPDTPADQQNQLAGKTLVFVVDLVSINN